MASVSSRSRKRATHSRPTTSGTTPESGRAEHTKPYVGRWTHDVKWNDGGTRTLLLEIGPRDDGTLRARYVSPPFSYRPVLVASKVEDDRATLTFLLVYYADGDVSSHTIVYELSRKGETLVGTYFPSWEKSRKVALSNVTDRYAGLWQHEVPGNDGKTHTLVLYLGIRDDGSLNAQFVRQFYSYQPVLVAADATAERVTLTFKLVTYYNGKDASHTVSYALSRKGEALEGVYAPSWEASRSASLVKVSSANNR